MVHRRYDFILQNLLQILEVDDHPGHWVGVALHGYFYNEIMAVAGGVSVLPEKFPVLFIAQRR